MIRAEYICHAGDDLLVVNAARVSFAKRSEWEPGEGPDLHPFFAQSVRLNDRDARLIGYLARNDHWTPFAHPQITLHCSAPVFVARQAFKSRVGFSMNDEPLEDPAFVENEVSRRYVDECPELYAPNVWRGRAALAKQGSSDEPVRLVDIGEGESAPPELLVEDAYRTCRQTYEWLIAGGVAPELARSVLPQAMITEWFWTGSLAAWARFCTQRRQPDAQAETAELAHACAAAVGPLFPVSWPALTGESFDWAADIRGAA